MKTFSLRTEDAKANWVEIDAEGKTLGRLASDVAVRLMGKDKPSYTAHVVCGDKVIVTNCAKIKVTGNKMTDKMYYSHSGYPGGLKEINLKDLMVKDPTAAVRHAVKGMLPKNKLQAEMLKNLKLYAGAEHNHAAQVNEITKVGA
jgi:large subunit ribosomal protein L13